MTQTLEWSDLWTALKEKPDMWIPTTEDMFWNMLECVPPRAQFGSRFLVGEPERCNEAGEDIHTCFRQVGKAYEAKNMTVLEFKAL